MHTSVPIPPSIGDTGRSYRVNRYGQRLPIPLFGTMLTRDSKSEDT